MGSLDLFILVLIWVSGRDGNGDFGNKNPDPGRAERREKKNGIQEGKKKAKFEFSGVATAPEGKREKGGEWE